MHVGLQAAELLRVAALANRRPRSFDPPKPSGAVAIGRSAYASIQNDLSRTCRWLTACPTTLAVATASSDTSGKRALTYHFSIPRRTTRALDANSETVVPARLGIGASSSHTHSQGCFRGVPGPSQQAPNPGSPSDFQCQRQ